MSRSSGRTALALALWTVVGGGCWEQVSSEWFAQMKEQPAVQALEGVAPRVPPEGTVPVGGIEARIDAPVPAFMPEAMALPNPVPATAESVDRGRYLFGIYCAVCHGADGMGNIDELPVARRLTESGAPPVPLVTVPGYPDGFLFTKIRYGKPLMPGYPQITPRDRWHIVNYLRVLVPRQGGAE